MKSSKNVKVPEGFRKDFCGEEQQPPISMKGLIWRMENFRP